MAYYCRRSGLQIQDGCYLIKGSELLHLGLRKSLFRLLPESSGWFFNLDNWTIGQRSKDLDRTDLNSDMDGFQ